MTEYLINFYQQWKLSETLSIYFSISTLLAFIFLVSFFINWIFKAYIIRLIDHFSKNSTNGWWRVITQHATLEKLSHLGPAAFVYWASQLIEIDSVPFTHTIVDMIRTLTLVYMVITVFSVISSWLDAFYEHLHTTETMKNKPLRGYIQFIKMFLGAIAIILAISLLIHQSPWALLASLGFISGGIIFIFRDTLLGFLANIQLSTYDLIRVGDWIAIEKFNVSGTVSDIYVNFIKIKAVDNSIITLPTSELINSSVQNWRGMVESGGRRMQRSIKIDLDSIKFCSDELLKRLKDLKPLQPYFQQKSELSKPLNELKLTNIELFRAYIKGYLSGNTKIHQGMTFLVRQLQSTETGVPLEICAFVNNVDWEAYENIQAEILEHLFAMIPLFELKIFQSPRNPIN